MLNAILFPILVVGGLGVLFGIILGIAAIDVYKRQHIYLLIIYRGQ